MRKPIFFIALIMTLLLVLTACKDKATNEIPGEVNEPSTEGEVIENPEVVVQQDSDENYDGDFVNPFSNNNNKIDYYYEVEVISGEEIYYNKFWVSGNKSRMELVASETQDNVITISDRDEKVSYIYSPEDNTVMIMDYNPTTSDYDENSNYVDSMKSLFGDPNQVKVEKGNFEGQDVRIFTGSMYGEKSIMWVSTKTQVPFKG